MVERPDRGDIVAQQRFPVEETDTALTLHKRAADEARRLFSEIYPLLREGRAPRAPQDHSRASYFGGRTPEDGRIDWRWPARRIYDLIRAVTHPYPGAFTTHAGRPVFVWWGWSESDRTGLEPGRLDVSSDAVRVGTGQGTLRLERVQAAGQPETEAREWTKAAHVRSGDMLGEYS